MEIKNDFENYENYAGCGSCGNCGGYEGDIDDGYEMSEEEELLMRVAACMNMLPGEEFTMEAFENACYMANVDPEEFTEEEIDELAAMM